MKNGFYNEKNVSLFRGALYEARKRLSEIHIHVSRGNSKLGDIPSISLLPYLTCPAVCKSSCAGTCYAAKLAALRPSCRKAWAENTTIAFCDIFRFRDELAQWIEKHRTAFFRFHVSGDMFSEKYFRDVVIATAERFPETVFMTYTKRHLLASIYAEGGGLPGNVRINLSADTENGLSTPAGLPFNVTDILRKRAEVPAGYTVCPGHCATCAATGINCFDECGDARVIFKQH